MNAKQNNDNNKGHHYCNLPKVKQRIFDPKVSLTRERLIIISGNKWMCGTQLKYYFFDDESDGEYVIYSDGSKKWITWKGTNGEKEIVREAFNIWKSQSIGLDFIETNDLYDAEIRIGFMRGDGSWSYLGRNILKEPQNQRTMNFGWNIADEIDTALHEIGHTLGFPHAHQNPKAGIVWNKEEVYNTLRGAPNYWDKKTIDHNIINKLPVNAIIGSEWDPNSIMQYQFEAGLIKKPEIYQIGLIPNPGLSPKDIQMVKFFYPKISENDFEELEVSKSVVLNLENSQQKNFFFKPKASRKYNIKTFGEMDAVMVLFKKEDNGQLRYLSGDDDSGEDKNASIEHKLLKGEEYVISIRQYYNSGHSSPIIIY